MTERNIQIRTAAMSDLDAIASVEAECFPAAEAATREEFAERLASYANHFWLMFEGKRLISFVDGFVTDSSDLTDEMYANAEMHDESGAWQMIFGVNTIPPYRRRGYAGQLIERAISDARDQGRKGIVLTCKDKLVSYYAKFGFEDEGISPNSTHGNAVWHQMRLTFEKGMDMKKALVLFPCDEETQKKLICAADGRCEFAFKDASWSEEDYHAPRRRKVLCSRQPAGAKNLGVYHSECWGLPEGKRTAKPGGFFHRISENHGIFIHGMIPYTKALAGR